MRYITYYITYNTGKFKRNARSASTPPARSTAAENDGSNHGSDHGKSGSKRPLSLSLPDCISACLSVCLPACLHACLPACLPACLHVNSRPPTPRYLRGHMPHLVLILHDLCIGVGDIIIMIYNCYFHYSFFSVMSTMSIPCTKLISPAAVSSLP